MKIRNAFWLQHASSWKTALISLHMIIYHIVLAIGSISSTAIKQRSQNIHFDLMRISIIQTLIFMMLTVQTQRTK